MSEKNTRALGERSVPKGGGGPSPAPPAGGGFPKKAAEVLDLAILRELDDLRRRNAFLESAVVLDVVANWCATPITDARVQTMLGLEADPARPGTVQATLIVHDDSGKRAKIKFHASRSPLSTPRGESALRLLRLGPGVWKIGPIVRVQEIGFACHLTVVGVPEPPPWEKGDPNARDARDRRPSEGPSRLPPSPSLQDPARG